MIMIMMIIILIIIVTMIIMIMIIMKLMMILTTQLKRKRNASLACANSGSLLRGPSRRASPFHVRVIRSIQPSMFKSFTNIQWLSRSHFNYVSDVVKCLPAVQVVEMTVSPPCDLVS